MFLCDACAAHSHTEPRCTKINTQLNAFPFCLLFFCLLPGTKSDLRIPNSEKFVTTAEGKKLKNKIRAYAMVECSAKKKHNLQDVFHEAVRAVEKKPHVKTRICRLL